MIRAPRVVGATLLGAIVLTAWFAPWFATSGPFDQNLAESLAAPSPQHWLGTDVFGRDQLVRLAHAARLSLGLALAVVLVAALLGCALAALASASRWLDRTLSLIADATMALPGLLLVLLVVAFAPGDGALLYVGLVAAMWVEYFRVVRLSVRAVWQSKHVEAARLAGFGLAYIARWHLLPEVWPMVVRLMSYGAVAAVLAIASLSFVSVGVRPPTPELGQMLVDLLPYYQEAPWLIGSTVATLFLFLLALVLLTGAGSSERSEV